METSKVELLRVYDNVRIRLKTGISPISLDFPQTKYYAFKIKYSNPIEDIFPKFECLIDNRVIGTTYFSDRNSMIDTLGIQLIAKGRHRLEGRTMFEPAQPIDYIEITSVDRVVERPLFSFITLTDTHILNKTIHTPSPTEELYSGYIPMYDHYDHDVNQFPHPANWINGMLYQKAPEIMEEVIKNIEELNPDFVIHTGDLVGEIRESAKAAKYFLDRLPCPYYIARGNHDNKDYVLSVFGKIFKDKLSFNHKGFHFIILDSCYFLSNDKVFPWPREEFNNEKFEGLIIPEEELKWLENNLSRHRDMPIFLFFHIPLVMSDNYPHPYDMRLHHYKKVLDVLDKYSNVKAIFSGHSHINDLAVRKDVYHFQTSSLIEYPMCYRQVVIFPSHIEVRTYQISGEFLQESFLTTPDNIFKEAPNGWVIGRNDNLYSEIL